MYTQFALDWRITLSKVQFFFCVQRVYSSAHCILTPYKRSRTGVKSEPNEYAGVAKNSKHIIMCVYSSQRFLRRFFSSNIRKVQSMKSSLRMFLFSNRMEKTMLGMIVVLMVAVIVNQMRGIYDWCRKVRELIHLFCKPKQQQTNQIHSSYKLYCTYFTRSFFAAHFSDSNDHLTANNADNTHTWIYHTSNVFVPAEWKTFTHVIIMHIITIMIVCEYMDENRWMKAISNGNSCRNSSSQLAVLHCTALKIALVAISCTNA